MNQPSRAESFLQTIHQQEKLKAMALITSKAGKNESAIQEAVAELYADVASRVKVIEEYLVAGGEPELSAFESAPSKIAEGGKLSLTITISELEHAGLGPLQHNSTGLPFRFVKPGASLTHILPIDRNTKKTLAIEIEHVSNADLLSRCQILIDGVAIKHRLAKVAGRQRLICRIPPSKKSTPTHLEFRVPPVGHGEKSTLAISDIHCVPTLSILAFLRKKATGG